MQKAAQKKEVKSAEERGLAAWIRAHFSIFVATCVFLFGAAVFFYPSIANWWNSLHQSGALLNYAQNVSNMDDGQYAQMISAAMDYNVRLAQTGELWNMTEDQQAEYDSLLDVDGTGIMGYITIPKINVQLPIYHGTNDSVLQSSIGHLAGTSLPVGGPSTHCVLSGHRGLPSARLFTDLDKLTEGDTFTLTVLDETLTYQVDQIHIVEPNDISNIQIEPGEDLCTLVTCTPYGINTHRLLVRGHRIPNANGDANLLADAIQIRPIYIAPFIAVPVLVLLIVYVFVSANLRGKKPNVEKLYLDQRGLEKPRVPVVSKEWLRESIRSRSKRSRKDKRS